MTLMVEPFAKRVEPSVSQQLRQIRLNQIRGFSALAVVSLLMALLLIKVPPTPLLFAWACYFLGLAAAIYQPRYGLYLIVGLSLVADWIMTPEFPFIKNFSSSESWLYAHDSLIFSPLETYIAVTTGSWLMQGLMRRKLDFHFGPLFGVVLLFTLCVCAALFYGIATGGNLTVALWQVRPLVYLSAMFFLASNLIRTRRHVNILLWILAIIFWIRGITGVIYVATVLNFDLGSVERIGNHAMSIYFASVFVMTIAAWLFGGTRAKRWAFLLMLPPMLFSFFANQRRASFIGLAIALIMIAVLMFVLRRKLFNRIVPAMGAFALVYTIVFWSIGGPLGMPVEAFKSVIGMGSTEDSSSNQYRDIENANIMYTIRLSPLGRGFGQKFSIAYALPDISFFEWWQYITHNAVLWMWMQMGPIGFMTMLFMFGLSLIVGARAIIESPDGVLRIAATTMTLYLMMHFVYTYVDMAWDTTSMVYIGMAMGMINCLHAVAARPLRMGTRRWPWQPAPVAEYI